MRAERRTIDCGPHGTVSAVIASPDICRAGETVAVILAHGAGNDMSHPLLSGVHEGLAARGYLSVKFNFPYTERGRRAPDPAPVLTRCFRAVLDAIRSDPALAPPAVIIGGKSLGGRMASHLVASWPPTEMLPIAGLLFLGYPLHPAGKPDQLRVGHLASIRVPMLFFAGTRDPLCRLALLEATLNRLPQASRHIVEGGDHSFAMPKRLQRSPQTVIDELVTASTHWIAAVVGSPVREGSDGR